jgi:hypothetical protein
MMTQGKGEEEEEDDTAMAIETGNSSGRTSRPTVAEFDHVQRLRFNSNGKYKTPTTGSSSNKSSCSKDTATTTVMR